MVCFFFVLGNLLMIYVVWVLFFPTHQFSADRPKHNVMEIKFISESMRSPVWCETVIACGV